MYKSRRQNDEKNAIRCCCRIRMISAYKRTKRAESVIKSVTSNIKLEIKWTQSKRNQPESNWAESIHTAYVHILILTSVFDFHTRASRKFIYPSHNYLIVFSYSSLSLSFALAVSAIRTSLHTVLISWHFNALSIDMLMVDFRRIGNECVYGFRDKVAKSMRLNEFWTEKNSLARCLLMASR